MVALQATALVRRFGPTVALDGADITVREGEIRGLLGPNGAGKTTLLRLLFGLVRPDAGRIELLGRELAEYGAAALDGVGGFVEDPCFYPYLSGRANLGLLARLDGLAAPRSEIDLALDRVGLTRDAGGRVGTYSTGMRQRLGIAAALLRRPRLLLLDEPTSGLDPAGARDVAVLVRQLAADGVGVLLSSHQIGELEKVCTAYTMLRGGRVVWDGTPAALETQAPASAHALATSDDERALRLLDGRLAARAQRAPDGGLLMTVRPGSLDALMLALADARIAVRRLELVVSPLESMFFSLTSTEALGDLEPLELTERVLAATTA